MAKNKTVKVLRVTARRDGFRRAGRAFGKAAIDIPLAELEREQIAALKDDPMLVVQEAEVEISGADEKSPTKPETE